MITLPVTNEQLRAEYEAGAFVWQLANKYEVSNTWINIRLARAGTDMRPAGNRPGEVRYRKLSEAEIPALLARFDVREKLQSIADDFRVTKERVRQIARNHGRSMRRAPRTCHACVSANLAAA